MYANFASGAPCRAESGTESRHSIIVPTSPSGIKNDSARASIFSPSSPEDTSFDIADGTPLDENVSNRAYTGNTV